MITLLTAELADLMTQHKPTILHVLDLKSRCVRTMEEFLLLYQDAVRDDYEMAVLFTGGVAPEVRRTFEQRGIFVAEGTALRGALLQALRSRLRVIHVHFFSPLNSLVLLRLLGIRLYYTEHTSDRGYTTSWLRRRKNAWLSSCYSGIFAVSEYVGRRSRELGFRRDRIHVVHNGVNLERLLRRDAPPRPAGPPIIGFVGQLTREKGVHLLPAILDEVARSQLEFRFEVAGDGELRDEVTSALAQRPYPSHMHGFLRDPSPVMERWRVCLGPSMWHEAFGLVFLEAMALGVPVVAFDVGGIAEVVRDGHVGLLAPRGDVVAFAAQVARLLADDTLYQQLVANTRRWIEEHFDLRRQVDAIVEWLPRPGRGRG